MPEPLTDQERREIRERAERAHAMISALCQPRGSEGSREWIMSIPARPDHDPDLVIGASVGDVRKLLDEIERLRADAGRLAYILANVAGREEADGDWVVVSLPTLMVRSRDGITPEGLRLCIDAGMAAQQQSHPAASAADSREG